MHHRPRGSHRRPVALCIRARHDRRSARRLRAVSRRDRQGGDPGARPLRPHRHPRAQTHLQRSDPTRAAHAVAIGLRDYVPVDDGINDAIRTARDHGARSSQHTHTRKKLPRSHHGSRSAGPTRARSAPSPTASSSSTETSCSAGSRTEGLPFLATGDVHRPEHLSGWKTLLPCTKDEAAVIDYLRSPCPVYLTRVDRMPLQVAA